MARKLRIPYSGAIGHGMSRGTHRSDIVRGDEDRELLVEACAKTDRQIHAWRLELNHCHLNCRPARPAAIRAGQTGLVGHEVSQWSRKRLRFGGEDHTFQPMPQAPTMNLPGSQR